MKFETVQINLSSDVFGLLSFRNFANMATLHYKFSSLLWVRILISRAQLLEDQLVPNLGLNLTQVSFSCVQRFFLG